MKAKIVISSEPIIEFEVSAQSVANIISDIPDAEENSLQWEVLAKHPAVEVRQNVARRDDLSRSAIEILVADHEVDVLRNLICSDKAKTYLTTDELLRLIKLDVETARSIADCIDSWSNADQDDLSEALAAHPDPKVRYALADNSSTPKKKLKLLQKDEDIAVRNAAKRSLGS